MLLSLGFLSCGKEDCDKLGLQDSEIEFAGTNHDKTFPGFPANTFVEGHITGIRVSNEGQAQFSDKKFYINDIEQTDVNNITYKIGENTAVFTSNCRPNDRKSRNCKCPDKVANASKTFTVLASKKLWIKKIVYWKQFPGFLGGYPDIYLIINNFSLRSSTTWDYNYDGRRFIEWELNDTISIPVDNFNFSITAWDKDRIGRDEKKVSYLLEAADFNNWEGDTLTHYSNGGFKFITEIVN